MLVGDAYAIVSGLSRRQEGYTAYVKGEITTCKTSMYDFACATSISIRPRAHRLRSCRFCRLYGLTIFIHYWLRNWWLFLRLLGVFGFLDLASLTTNTIKFCNE
jgi:hypothetical protein